MKILSQWLFILMVSIMLVGCTSAGGSTTPPQLGIKPLGPAMIPSPATTSPPAPSEPLKRANNIFGITIYTFDEAGGLFKMAEAGTQWTRNGFLWSRIEPNPGDRLWDVDLEQGLIRLADLNITPVMLIERTPRWALKEGYSCGAVAEDKFPALGQFIYDLVQRYSVLPYNVHYWELWNEPDAAGILGCWGDPSDGQYYGGAYYGRMLKAVYPRIKEADPDAQVLVGGLLLDCDPGSPPEGKDCFSSHFLEGILSVGAGEDFDGISFHAYDFYTGINTYENPNWHSSSSTTGPVSIAKANFLKQVLSRYGYMDKYLLNTETAIFYGPNIMKPVCDSAAPPDIEIAKAYYVVQSYAVAAAQGWKANVWYSAFGVRCSGLLNEDMTPKASYYAYQFTQNKLAQAVFTQSIESFGGVVGYEYKIPGRTLWIIWSLDERSVTIRLPETPIEVNKIGQDGFAVTEANTLLLSLDGSPVFIEFVE